MTMKTVMMTMIAYCYYLIGVEDTGLEASMSTSL